MKGRVTITFLLLLALAAQTFYQPSILLSYYLNTAAYAQKCVNKARPMLHCNGKCLLMKKIREAEKKDKDLPEQRSGKGEVLSSRSYFASLPPRDVNVTVTVYSKFIEPIHPEHSAFVFHPPAVS